MPLAVTIERMAGGVRLRKAVRSAIWNRDLWRNRRWWVGVRWRERVVDRPPAIGFFGGLERD